MGFGPVSVGELVLGFEELPELLTVEEAAVFLRVSRGVGYQLARRFTDTNGRRAYPSCGSAVNSVSRNARSNGC